MNPLKNDFCVMEENREVGLDYDELGKVILENTPKWRRLIFEP